jgi:SpoVK/Ycf46/Vps4 family AAA+-type ATPase
MTLTVPTIEDVIPHEISIRIAEKIKSAYALVQSKTQRIMAKIYCSNSLAVSESFCRWMNENESLCFEVISTVPVKEIKKLTFVRITSSGGGFSDCLNMLLLGQVIGPDQIIFMMDRCFQVLAMDLPFGIIDYNTQIIYVERTSIPPQISFSDHDFDFLKLKIPKLPFLVVSDNELEFQLFMEKMGQFYIVIEEFGNLINILDQMASNNVLFVLNLNFMTRSEKFLIKEILKNSKFSDKIIGLLDHVDFELFAQYVEIRLPTHADRKKIVQSLLTDSLFHQTEDVLIAEETVNPAISIVGTKLYLKKDAVIRSRKQRLQDQPSSKFLDDLAAELQGFSLSDIRDVFAKAVIADETVSQNRLMELAKSSAPSNLRDIVFTLPDSSLRDLFGLDHTLEFIKSQIIRPLREPESLGNIVKPRGCIIYGPSGTGKTSLAAAIVRETGLASVYVTAPSLRSKIVGESEKRIASLFAQCRKSAPCIMLIENFEMVCPKRIESGGTDQRIVTTFLQEMDGIFGDSGVFIVAITSDVKQVDNAVQRPGRLDVKIELKIPDATNRREILGGKLCSIPHDINESEIDRLVELSDGYTSSDVCGMLSTAIMNCIKRTGDILNRRDFPILVEK